MKRKDMINFVIFVTCLTKEIMTYPETLHYLYTRVPMFQQTGLSAYKPGLDTTIALDEHFGHPHKAFQSIHVAGTNGKGSTSHLLAAILQLSGYKVGLYTSPHLLDFRERIKVNGRKASEAFVVDFVERHRNFFEPLHPSFFELTTAMAFEYFKEQQVDVAVVEVGLGGRIDCTNIITPLLSIITNISKDHTQFLGDTLAQIAFEKAGIAKAGVPLLLGESADISIYDTIRKQTEAIGAPFYFAPEMGMLKEEERSEDRLRLRSAEYGVVEDELMGEAQPKNARTVLSALHLLREQTALRIEPQAVVEGFAQVVELTGLMGRWQRLANNPCPTVCDTGHNVGGWEDIARQLRLEWPKEGTWRIVIGMVADKDINSVLALMPKEATYYFTQASVSRAMQCDVFAAKAAEHGLQGEIYTTVEEAVRAAQQEAAQTDALFIGGSTFVVADALPLFPEAIK